jgi:hypothetical protein
MLGTLPFIARKKISVLFYSLILCSYAKDRRLLLFPLAVFKGKGSYKRLLNMPQKPCDLDKSCACLSLRGKGLSKLTNKKRNHYRLRFCLLVKSASYIFRLGRLPAFASSHAVKKISLVRFWYNSYTILSAVSVGLW